MFDARQGFTVFVRSHLDCVTCGIVAGLSVSLLVYLFTWFYPVLGFGLGFPPFKPHECGHLRAFINNPG